MFKKFQKRNESARKLTRYFKIHKCILRSMFFVINSAPKASLVQSATHVVYIKSSPVQIEAKAAGVRGMLVGAGSSQVDRVDWHFTVAAVPDDQGDLSTRRRVAGQGGQATLHGG